MGEIRCATLAGLAVLAALAGACVWWARKKRREGFSAAEAYSASRELFARQGGAATYSEFKTALPGADPVTYADIRGLWQAGRLTPGEVAQAI